MIRPLLFADGGRLGCAFDGLLFSARSDFATTISGGSPLSHSPLTSSGIVDSAAAESAETPPARPPSGDESVDPSWRALAPQSIMVERIGSWALTLVLSVIGAVVISSILAVNWPPDWWGRCLMVGYAMIVPGLMVASHVLPAVAYRHTRYRLSDVGFEIRRGIFWRSAIIVPHNRVQHTDVAQGPLQRSFDLGRLIIYTAGTQHASVELNGLDFQTACELRDALVGRLEQTDGV